MKATTKTLLATLLSVTALGVGTNAYADGRGGWRDGDRYENRWEERRHDEWRHHRHHHDRNPYYYREGVYFYAPPPVAYPGPVFYGPPVYRAPRGPSVVIDFPPIVIR